MGARMNKRGVKIDSEERERVRIWGNWTEREGEKRKWAYNEIREMSEF